MSDIIIQIVGLLALLAVMLAAYGRWVRPRNLGWEAKGVLLLIIATMVGGLVGSTGWWFDIPQAFSWDLPPLASRMLAVAGWAFGAATLMSLQRPTRQRIRLVLLMLAVYLIPLAVAIILFHRDRFDWQAPITYAFFFIVTLLILPTIWYLMRPPQVIPDITPHSPAQIVRAWLMIVAIVTVLWGIALFLTDKGPMSLVWVWPGDLLSSRLIAVMLLTIATAAVYSLNNADVAHVTLTMLAAYGLGVALANLWSVTAGKPVQPLYLIVFVVMGVVSLWLRRSMANPQAV